jgi:hypothetical protein
VIAAILALLLIGVEIAMAGYYIAPNAVGLSIVSIPFTGSITGLVLSLSHPGCGKLEFALTWAIGVRNVLATNIPFLSSRSMKMISGMQAQAKMRRSLRVRDGLILEGQHPPKQTD